MGLPKAPTNGRVPRLVRRRATTSTVEHDVGAGQPSEVFRPSETPLPLPVESHGTDTVLPSFDWPVATVAADGPDGGNIGRGWIGVVFVAVLVAAATALGVGVGVAASIRGHNTTTIKFSPSTSVFPHMNDVSAVLARPSLGGRDPGVRARLCIGPSERGDTVRTGQRDDPHAQWRDTDQRSRHSERN